MAIHEKGWAYFPELVRWHLAYEPDFPAPYRWGVLFFGNLACALRSPCDERALAWVSSIAGIAVVALVALIALKLFSRKTAMVATALAITSPLHLELGRRAYADELHTALLLLSLLALAHLAMDPPRKKEFAWFGLCIMALTLAWSVKESLLFLLPALALGLYAWRSPRALKWTDGALLTLPPLLALLVFVGLNHGFSQLGSLLIATRESLVHPYSLLFQQGPPHRPLIELFTLSPGLFALLPVAAFAALGFAPSRPAASGTPSEACVGRERALALLLIFVAVAAAFAFLPKNLRFYNVLDPLARLLVAWLVCEVIPWGKPSSAWCVALVLANAAFELAVFHRTFVRSAVTDPTASAIFGALELVPGEIKRWHPTRWVNVCALSSGVFAWVAAYVSKFKGRSILFAILISVSAFTFPQLLRTARTPLTNTSRVQRVPWDTASFRPALEEAK